MKKKNISGIIGDFKKEEVVIIDITTEKITILLVNRRKDEVIIKDMSILRDLEDCFKEGMIVKPDRLVNEIHKCIKEIGIRCKNIWISYGSSMLQSKIVKLVEMNDRDLSNFVELEYQRQFPMRSKMNYVMDYQPLGRYGEESDVNLLVLLASVPKSEIGDVLREFNKRKYKVKIIDANINGIKNIMTNYKTKDKNKIIFDIGKTYSTFITVLGNVLVFIRDIDFGYENLIKEIQKNTKISYEEIESLLINKGIYSKDSDDKEDYLIVIEKSIKSFLEGLYKSIEYVKSNFNTDITDLWLIGDGVHIKGIDELIEENLSIKCIRWEFNETLFDGTLKIINDSGYELGDDHLKSIGLSLRGLNK